MTKDLDWGHLPFSYIKTNGSIRCSYKSGVWGDIQTSAEETINLHMAATCLHYGQECFEGMKAYRGKDGKVRIFRWEENARRIQRSAAHILMPEIPEQLFHDMLIQAVKLNEEFVPPFGTGATLYIRPLLIGTSAQVGLNSATEYLFIIFVTPVGPYFKGGFSPVDLLIDRRYDRAAPLGTGKIKIGGNYAASLKAAQGAKAQGYSAVLYLDPKEKQYIDECGPANFFAIKGNKYITPESSSVLPSITNMSLQDLAKHLGFEVEKRPIHISELSTFDEVGACGTAAVVSPVGNIDDPELNMKYCFAPDGKPGKVSTQLYNLLTGIQFGEEEDIFGWVTIVE